MEMMHITRQEVGIKDTAILITFSANCGVTDGVRSAHAESIFQLYSLSPSVGHF